MGPPHAHPTDPLLHDLLSVYRGSQQRLADIVRAGLSRGLDASRIGTEGAQVGDATLAYRERQLAQAHSVLRELDGTARRAGPLIIGRAYTAGLVTLDKSLGLARARGDFGRVHVRAVAALAEQMTGSLTAATARAGRNVDQVFRLAGELIGPLPARGRIGGVNFLGRRFDDDYRRVSLSVTAGGIADLDTRRQVTERLAKTLVTEGVTTATAGYVDRAGRRWGLDSYSAMIARTTTREAVSHGTANRMREHGVDLVTISEHAHPADECTPYEGKTWSLDGDTPGYDVLDTLPPFHPNCVHVVTPAASNLDDYEAELRTAVERPVSASRSTAGRRPRLDPAQAAEAAARQLLSRDENT